MSPSLNSLKIWLSVKFFVIAFSACDASAEDATAEPNSEAETAEAAPDAPAEETPHAQATFVGDHKYHEETLASYLADHAEPVWLETPNGRFLALWQNDHNGSPLGAILIVPGLGSPPAGSALPPKLQGHLAQTGWPTLTIHPAREAPPQHPKRSLQQSPAKATDSNDTETKESGTVDNDDQGKTPPPEPSEPSEPVDETKVIAEDTAPVKEPTAEPEPSEYTVEDAHTATFARIEAGVAYLQSQGHYNISLLGYGTGAWLSLLYLQEGAANLQPAREIQKNNQRATITQPIRALIMLDVFGPPSQTQPKELLLFPTIPALDLYSVPYGPTQVRAAERKRAAKRNRYGGYVQRYLPPDPPHQEAGRTAKTIRGFLAKNASGVELD